MMATRDKTRSDEQARSSPASERVSGRARESAEPAREVEPLDEKSLEQVMRECPL
jgi:hypothetical protein